MNWLNKLYERTKDSPEYKRKIARAGVTADLRILIANAEMSQKEVAEKIGISPAALSAKLSGEKNLTLDSIVDIADAVGSAVDLVFRPAGTKRALQTWEVDAKTERLLDRAANILREAEALREAYTSVALFEVRMPAEPEQSANDDRFEKYAEAAPVVGEPDNPWAMVA